MRNKRKSSSGTFAERVLEVVRGIPRGQVRSYAEVARLAGVSGAARVVGTLMRKNLDPSVPCHRVVRSDGSVGEYNRGGTEAKTRILHEEGVKFCGIKVLLEEKMS